MKLHPPLETPFPLWEKAVLWRALSAAGVKCTKKLERELWIAARAWLPYDFYESPWGDYWFLFNVELEMERRWKFKEFREGRKFGRDPKEPYRDANPYTEMSRKRSWDRGYILGLAER